MGGVPVSNLDSEIFKRIGSRIREVRIDKRMSQADLAEKAHISLPLVSEVELGKTKMRLETFIQIVEALQVSADSILRADIPEVNGMYQSEFADLLSDCTPTEIDSLLKIVRELKETMHSAKKDNSSY